MTLTRKHIRLEPLAAEHARALAAAAAEDPGLYNWSTVPRDEPEAARYIATALSWARAGTAVPFAIVRQADDRVIGSTRLFDLERWPWPAAAATEQQRNPDGCELGYTWLAASAIRTAANTESKLLLLTHAFERIGVRRVCLHTDARNQRSRTAMERIGAQFEGILRSHRLASDLIPRDSARYSILAAEWPGVKARLTGRADFSPA